VSYRTLFKTRKLSYRKEHRARRPVYGYPENFQQTLSAPTLAFPQIFNGLLFEWTL